MAAAPSDEQLRDEIERALGRALDRAAERIPDAALLIDELRGVTTAGGKRLRPAFCYWGYRAAGGSHGEPIVRAAASLELLHTFALVHDDIMDESDQRRGRPTVYATHGPSAALLAGDLALVLADDELMGSGFPPDALARAFVAYSRMRQEVIAGQFLELRTIERPVVSEEEARRIAILKSGRYSVQEPLLVGALLADAGHALLADLEHVGDLLGEAFQLVDDLLGTFGDPGSTGKPVDADIRSGKRNVLFAKTAASLDGTDRAWFLAAWGAAGGLDEEDVSRVRGLIESSGARAATESLLEELAGAARARIESLDVDDASKHALLALAARAIDRRH